MEAQSLVYFRAEKCKWLAGAPGLPPEEHYVLWSKGTQKTEPHTPPPIPTLGSQASYYQEGQSGTWYRSQCPPPLAHPHSQSGEGKELLTKMFGVIPGREGLAWAKAGKLMRDEAEQAQA